METGSNHEAFLALLIGMYILSICTVLATSFITAPYGRHARQGWGPQIPARLGWILMESPALWCTSLVFFRGEHRGQLASRVLLGIFLFHYAHRVLVYPFRAKLGGKKMPAVVAALAFSYNIYNGYLQGYQISAFHSYHESWLWSPPMLCGLALFSLGFLVNVWADSVLFGLRTGPSDKSYKIPRGLLYDLVTCPNYLGEIIEWLAWALMTWSWAGLAFFLYTCSNLVPRAVAHHEWYMQKFDDYPPQRKALIPLLL